MALRPKPGQHGAVMKHHPPDWHKETLRSLLSGWSALNLGALLGIFGTTWLLRHVQVGGLHMGHPGPCNCCPQGLAGLSACLAVRGFPGR